jgi:hypothetical protein
MYFDREAGALTAVQSQRGEEELDGCAVLIGGGHPDSLCFPDEPALGESAGQEFDVKCATPVECVNPDCGTPSLLYELHGTAVLVCECPTHKWQFFYQRR